MDKIILYDFDGTLTPYAWTKFGVLEECGLEGGAYNPDFIRMVRERTAHDQSDPYSALWKVYLELLEEKGFALTDENFGIGAPELEYNPGVKKFLTRLKDKGVKNYVTSSSLKVFLEQTQVAPLFEKIFATEFSYNDRGIAEGVEFLMNEQTKVEVIEKILDENGLGENLDSVIYVGDGLTDIPAMEYVKNRGGETIFVQSKYNEVNVGDIRETNAITLSAVADFSEGSEVWNFVEKWRKSN